MSEQPQQSQAKTIRGIVKQVLSGDTIVIRGVPKGGPPPEKTISLSFITAPKLAKRVQQVSDSTQDDAFAWEAREFLRKRLIGQNVFCSIERSSNREYATVYHGPDPTSGENINELLVKEGLVGVRGDNIRQPTPELQRLLELQEQAKKDRKGKWDDSLFQDDYKRKITWTVDNMMDFVFKMDGKPIKAVIEHVRDGSTVRAFLLPDFVYITLMMSGIRSPQFKLDSEGKPDNTSKVDFADEARFFTESRLLQQDVEVILESFNGPNFVGSIIHPKGNIAEELLKAGLARCVDWSIAKMKKSDVEKLRHAEKIAKEKKLKLWKDWKPPPPISDKEFVGTVIEVINGDALIVKLPNGDPKKIFLASVRPPRPGEGQENRPSGKMSRQLYDVPWMFEAREFLRKKLIGKKVNVSVDYIQPPRDNMAEKCCCTVTISNVNVAETLVSKGLATVVRYRQNDDQRASAYDSLLAAEMKALKGQKGLHAKKDIPPTHRVNDYSGEPAKAKGLLPHLQRLPKVEALVEYVASGSRMRVFIPKESSLVTFLLSGIDIRVQRTGNGNGSNEELALQFTRERVMQREVEIKVETCDRAGNFIGWLWCEGVNLSVALVENGLAKVHASGENSEFSKHFMNAKNAAKSNGLWKFADVEETNDVIEEDKTPDRKIDYKEVIVVVTSGISFYCQFTSEEAKLNALQEKLAKEMTANPPLAGAYTPKKGDICAAKFSFDNNWYRAKVEKVAGGKVSVHYIDYGNKAEVATTDCAHLPSSVDSKDEKHYARQYTLICVRQSNDNDFQVEQSNQFYNEACTKKLHLNEELNQSGVGYATLVDLETKEDVGKKLIADGLLLVDKRRERKFQKLIAEYTEAEEEAKRKRLNMWEYGDVREDDDKEFGMGR